MPLHLCSWMFLGGAWWQYSALSILVSVQYSDVLPGYDMIMLVGMITYGRLMSDGCWVPSLRSSHGLYWHSFYIILMFTYNSVVYQPDQCSTFYSFYTWLCRLHCTFYSSLSRRGGVPVNIYQSLKGVMMSMLIISRSCGTTSFGVSSLWWSSHSPCEPSYLSFCFCKKPLYELNKNGNVSSMIGVLSGSSAFLLGGATASPFHSS